MRPWSVVVAVVAALAILTLVVSGSDGRDFSGREREGIEERAAQVLVALPVALGPESAMTVVVDRGLAPAEVAALLEEARGLIASAAGQPPDQAKPALEQAIDKLDTAMDRVEDAADDASNDVVRIRLLRLHHTLEAIRDVLELRIEGL